MEKINNTLKRVQELVKEFPNDKELGSEIRKLVKENSGTYLEQIKRENEERKKNSREEKERERMIKLCKEVVIPYDSTAFRIMFFNWIEYKRIEHGFKYKSRLSLQGALKKLSDLSKGSEEDAIMIISQSIENGWKGFFELKTNNNGKEEIGISEDYLQRIANGL